MDSALRVDHPVSRIVVHPGGPNEVMRAVQWPRLGADSFLQGKESANSGGSQLLLENLLRLPDAAQIKLVPSPEHLDFSLTEAIRLSLQNDAVRAVRRLLDE